MHLPSTPWTNTQIVQLQWVQGLQISHPFLPSKHRKKEHSKTFLEVRVSEKTSNLVMLRAQKIPPQPRHFKIYLEKYLDFCSRLGTVVKSLGLD